MNIIEALEARATNRAEGWCVTMLSAWPITFHVSPTISIKRPEEREDSMADAAVKAKPETTAAPEIERELTDGLTSSSTR